MNIMKMRKPVQILSALSIICLQCFGSQTRGENAGKAKKTVDEVYSTHCLPRRTDRLVYRHQNESHIFVGFDSLENNKVFALFWKIKEKNHEILDKFVAKTFHGPETKEFRQSLSVENVLAATNSRKQRDFIKDAEMCQQSILTMSCLIEAFARSANKMKKTPCSKG